VGFYPLKTIVEKTVDVSTWENIPRKLLKNSPYVLLVFSGDDDLHGIGPQIVV
jgi:hypothetical protein